MTQKKRIAAPEEAVKPQEFKPTDATKSSDILHEITSALASDKELSDDTIVWTCLTRLDRGGCLRTNPEGTPPDCPIFDTVQNPLFVVPRRVRLGYLRKRLTPAGNRRRDAGPFDHSQLIR